MHKGIVVAMVSVMLLQPILAVGQDLEISFTPVLSIGVEGSDMDDVFFGWIREVEVDPEGRIYAADPESRTIHLFSAEGEHLATLGGRGKGPGEFMDLTSMDRLPDGRIAVTDRRLSRITYFTPMGEDQEVYNFDFAAGFTWEMAAMENGMIALVKTGFQYEDEDHRNILSVYSTDFSQLIGRYLDTGLISQGRHPAFEQAIYEVPMYYHLAALGGHRLALTHHIYHGSVYVVDLGNQEQANILTSSGPFTEFGESYIILADRNNGNNVSREELRKKYYGLGSGSHGYTYQVKLGSEALLSNDRYLFNFVRTTEGRESKHYLEIFRSSGEYVGYGILDGKVQIREGMRSVFKPLHMDNNNQLYYLDYSSNVPILKVAKITFKRL